MLDYLEAKKYHADWEKSTTDTYWKVLFQWWQAWSVSDQMVMYQHWDQNWFQNQKKEQHRIQLIK